MKSNIISKCIICASIFASIFTLSSCEKDLQDEINGSGWNHERSIINIQLENQIGKATIENISATEGIIELSINVGAQASMATVKIVDMEISYQAESSVKIGETVNLSNGSTDIKVKATTGEVRTYTISANSFTEDIEGTWDIKSLTIYGGTGPEYGGGAVMQLSDKPWCWSEVYGPEVECDNQLVFKMTGVAEDGSTMGTCLNNAGADGKYADFMFMAAVNKEGDSDIDLEHFYRQIPEGESTWVRNYSDNTITFTDKNGIKTVGKLVSAGEIDCGNGKSHTVETNAFQFSLNGTDDWTNIYSDYDKFAKKPRIYWIGVTKVK